MSQHWCIYSKYVSGITSCSILLTTAVSCRFCVAALHENTVLRRVILVMFVAQRIAPGAIPFRIIVAQTFMKLFIDKGCGIVVFVIRNVYYVIPLFLMCTE